MIGSSVIVIKGIIVRTNRRMDHHEDESRAEERHGKQDDGVSFFNLVNCT